MPPQLYCNPKRTRTTTDTQIKKLEQRGGLNLQVAIAGAGISGLAAAIALAKQDHTVTVHEQSVRLEPVGAGLQLGPNAVRALEHLGVWATLKDLCVAPACIRICDAQTGHELSVLKLGTLSQIGLELPTGWPTAPIFSKRCPLPQMDVKTSRLNMAAI